MLRKYGERAQRHHRRTTPMSSHGDTVRTRVSAWPCASGARSAACADAGVSIDRGTRIALAGRACHGEKIAPAHNPESHRDRYRRVGRAAAVVRRHAAQVYDYPPIEAYGPLSALRLQVQPAQTEVFVDGYYAGPSKEFDGVFERLRLESGEHDIDSICRATRAFTRRSTCSPTKPSASATRCRRSHPVKHRSRGRSRRHLRRGRSRSWQRRSYRRPADAVAR